LKPQLTLCLSCSLVYCLLRLPETRGKSYGELEVLFENRVPAWKFAKTKVDQFDLGEDASTPVQATEIKEDFGKVEDTGKVTYR
jgi:MFS transporter, SP family, general alpha glucoside:H+ symporter